MPLWVPPSGGDTIETNQATTAATGTLITASATANVKGSWTSVIASTARESYGIGIHPNNSFALGTNTGQRLDIGIGAAPSAALIPDLLTGWAEPWEGASGLGGQSYYFPIFIPAGVQLSARLQAVIASDTVSIIVFLYQRPLSPERFVGSRVTAYGIGGTGSQGTNVTAGNSAYGTAASLIASTTNPIRYMQLGAGGGQDTTTADARIMARIMSGATVLIDSLGLSCTQYETVQSDAANFSLSHAAFNLPSGIDLSIAAMKNATTNNVFDFAVYGVD